ncbi:MAG: 3-isopropylmalate dehydratase large subunit [bacterium]
MGMTITEKILAAHASERKVRPGDMVLARVDLALANDVTGPLAIERFSEIGSVDLFDRERVVFVADHFTPNKDIAAASQCQRLRQFAKAHGLTHYYEGGEAGVEHALLPEKGLIVPGDLIVGADSHTCTYGAFGSFATGVGSTDLAAVMAAGEIWLRVPESIRVDLRGELKDWVEAKDVILFLIGQIGVDGARYCALEFSGPAVAQLGMAGRMTMANMAVEAGAKNGIFAADETAAAYLRPRTCRNGISHQSDAGAEYKEVRSADLTGIAPQVAVPFSPDRVMAVRDAGLVAVDQVVIGSCTNGRIEDLRSAARVLRGRRAARSVRLLVLPATQECYRLALEEGLLAVFLDAGAVVGPPTCGPCLGGHLGILAPGETAVATTNRNFPGRMGDVTSRVYLTNPSVAAASAVLGRLGTPDQLLGA